MALCNYIYVFVLGPLTMQFRDCTVTPGKVSQSTQKCFADGYALKMTYSKLKKTPDFRKYAIDWNTMSGTVCSCFYDKCNDISFEELSALAVAPTAKDVPTSTATTTSNNEGGKQITAIAGSTRGINGKHITITATTTRGNTGKHTATRTSDSEVPTTGKNKNDKPIIGMWLLLLCFVITLLF